MDKHFNASVLHALPKQYASVLKQIDDGVDDNRSFDMSASERPLVALLILNFMPAQSPSQISAVTSF